MAYIGNGPGVASQRILTTLTATEGQTSFTPSAGYTLGYVDVFLNGVKLIDGTDYAAADGVSIVLTEAATLDDTVEVVAYFPRGLSDGYTKAEADGRYEPLDSAYTKSEADGRYEPLDSAYTKAEADARYVEVSGDTMTGNLTVPMVVTSSALSNRNLIINSSFLVNQRGVTSTTGVSGSSKFLADRWITYCNGSDWSASIQEVTLPDGTVANSLKTVATTSAASGFFHPFQKVEAYGKDYLQGKQVTLSAWVRTNVAGQFIRICDTVSCHLLGTAIPADGQWRRVSAVHTMPTNMNTGASDHMQFQPLFNTVDLAVGDYCEFALPQMELGDTATPFEHRSYGDELQRCMRYYEHSYLGSSTPPVNGADTTSYGAGATSLAPVALWHNASAQGRARVDFKVVKRAQPTMTKIGNSQGYLGYISTGGSAPTSNNNVNFNTNIQLTAEGTWGALIAIQFTGSPVWGIGGGWIADAEL